MKIKLIIAFELFISEIIVGGLIITGNCTELERVGITFFSLIGFLYAILFFSDWKWLSDFTKSFTPVFTLIILIGYYTIFPIIIYLNDGKLLFNDKLCLLFGVVVVLKVWFMKLTADQY